MEAADYKRLNLETYAKIAENYADRDRRAVSASALHTIKAIDGFARTLRPRASILDMGCGAGRDAATFSERGFDVTGIDISEPMLEQARLQAPQATFLKKDIENFRFDGPFDGIWANASLLHLPKRAVPGAIRAIAAHLRPGGQLFIRVKQGNGERIVDEERFGTTISRFYSFYRPQEMTAILQTAGFEVTKQQDAEAGKWLDTFATKTAA